jgi:hypothetical protein
MNSKDRPEITVQMLMQLRKEADALRTITSILRVKEMGPADHIRTKHEAKAFVESADLKSAEALIKQARERIAVHEIASNRVRATQSQSEKP